MAVCRHRWGKHLGQKNHWGNYFYKLAAAYRHKRDRHSGLGIQSDKRCNRVDLCTNTLAKGLGQFVLSGMYFDKLPAEYTNSLERTRLGRSSLADNCCCRFLIAMAAYICNPDRPPGQYTHSDIYWYKFVAAYKRNRDRHPGQNVQVDMCLYKKLVYMCNWDRDSAHPTF